MKGVFLLSLIFTLYISSSLTVFSGRATITVYPNAFKSTGPGHVNCAEWIGENTFTNTFDGVGPSLGSFCNNNTKIVGDLVDGEFTVNGFRFAGSRRAYPNSVLSVAYSLYNGYPFNVTFQEFLDSISKRDLSDVVNGNTANQDTGFQFPEENQPENDFLRDIWGTTKCEAIRFNKPTDASSGLLFDVFRQLSYSVYRPNCTFPITPSLVLIEITFNNPGGGVNPSFTNSITITAEGVLTGFSNHFAPANSSAPLTPDNGFILLDDLAITVNAFQYSYNYVSNTLQNSVSPGIIDNFSYFNYFFGMYKGSGTLGYPCINLVGSPPDPDFIPTGPVEVEAGLFTNN